MMFVSRLDANRLAYSRLFRGNRSMYDSNQPRPMSTIVELSPEPGQISNDNLDFEQEDKRISLSPLAQGKSISNFLKKNSFDGVLGTLTSVFSTIMAISKKTGTTTVSHYQGEEQMKLSPIEENNSTPEKQIK